MSTSKTKKEQPKKAGGKATTKPAAEVVKKPEAVFSKQVPANMFPGDNKAYKAKVIEEYIKQEVAAGKYTVVSEKNKAGTTVISKVYLSS